MVLMLMRDQHQPGRRLAVIERLAAHRIVVDHQPRHAHHEARMADRADEYLAALGLVAVALSLSACGEGHESRGAEAGEPRHPELQRVASRKLHGGTSLE